MADDKKSSSLGYLTAVRHPWPVLLFLAPLLLIYEYGVLSLGGSQAMSLRNGADAWMRYALEAFGLSPLYAAPLLVLLILLVWNTLRLTDRPSNLWVVLPGMALESFFFAVGLWAVGRSFPVLLEELGVAQMRSPDAALGPTELAQVVTFLGAGIYEEVLFRLLGFAGLRWLFQLADTPTMLATPVAALVSALAFAAAHHLGPSGDAVSAPLFLFRTLAGLYFVGVFLSRGLGVAAGAHAAYDVLVGVDFDR